MVAASATTLLLGVVFIRRQQRCGSPFATVERKGKSDIRGADGDIPEAVGEIDLQSEP